MVTSSALMALCTALLGFAASVDTAAGLQQMLEEDDICQPNSTDSECSVSAMQFRASEMDSCRRSGPRYTLDWAAEGSSFFDDWTFVTEDDVHGAHHFASEKEAKRHGVVKTSRRGAHLGVGGIRKPSFHGEAKKRYSVNIHTNYAWKPSPGFLVLMKYKRLPQGCGIWPSFWAMNSDSVWPKGGELDILEYANQEHSIVSFHTSGGCALDGSLSKACKPKGSGQPGPTDCTTNYFENKIGCKPAQRQLSGKDLAKRPGVVAAEWTATHIRVYYIPESEIPDDVKKGSPDPSLWSKFVVAHLPFEGECASVGPQELVLNVQLCGDWAGGTWEKSSCGKSTGYNSKKWSCKAGLSAPEDCCTQYVTSRRQEWNMRRHGYFHIDYLKVFTADGASHTTSGTFRRGGQMLRSHDRIHAQAFEFAFAAVLGAQAPEVQG